MAYLSSVPGVKTPQQEITDYFFSVKGWDRTDKSLSPLYARFVSVAKKEILVLSNGDVEMAKSKIKSVAEWADRLGLSWNLSTVVKRWMENHEVEKRPYTKEGDELIEKNGKMLIKNWDGRLLNYDGPRTDIIWK